MRTQNQAITAQGLPTPYLHNLSEAKAALLGFMLPVCMIKQRSTIIANCAFITLVCGCGSDEASQRDAAQTDSQSIDAATNRWASATPLPIPIANNAVAAMKTATGCDVYTFGGIGTARTSAAITTAAYRWRADQWTKLPDLPGLPRIASSAVGIAGKVYVIGGYSIAANGDETSSPALDIWDPANETWTSGPSLAAGIDDAIVDVWRDRYLMVASGWSTTGSVRTMSVLDTTTMTWSQATPFPGAPVFGGTGGIVGDDVFVVDGVATINSRYVLQSQLWVGRLAISGTAFTIDWQQKPNHSGGPRYRAAAGALDGKLMIVGGTSEPYNFDGLRYDNNMPAMPSADGLTIDNMGAATTVSGPAATMDHRSLAICGSSAFLVGGMIAGPAVSSDVWRLR
jgi:N-acetylneuraminic acid mutarotase